MGRIYTSGGRCRASVRTCSDVCGCAWQVTDDSGPRVGSVQATQHGRVDAREPLLPKVGVVPEAGRHLWQLHKLRGVWNWDGQGHKAKHLERKRWKVPARSQSTYGIRGGIDGIEGIAHGQPMVYCCRSRTPMHANEVRAQGPAVRLRA